MRPRPFLACLVLVHCGLLAYSAWRHSPTQDEVAHLPAGLAIWRFGQFDLYRVNPPLVRAIAALGILPLEHGENWEHYIPHSPQRREWVVGGDFVDANDGRALWLYTVARWVCIPFSLVGLLVCWRWGGEIAGVIGGVIAATLWCFCPNVLGHGALITPDIAATSLGLLAAWRFQHWLQDRNWRNAFLAGICLGLALLSKTYWIVLFGLWPLVALADRWLARGERVPETRNALQECLQLGGILLIGLNLLNFGYLFEGTGTRLGDFEFYSQALSGKTRDLQYSEPGNRFRDHRLGAIPVPLPQDYVTGIDIQKREFEIPTVSYFLGEYRDRGWLHYYLVGLLLKTPVGLWILVLLGIVGGLLAPARRDRVRALLPVLATGGAIFCLVSLQTGMNHHVRYVFPVLPLLFLIAAQAGLLRCRWPVWGALALVIGSSLSIYPHSISYFNWVSGGPVQGAEKLGHSNVDWGQDLIFVKEWLEKHPEARPVTLAWWAMYDARRIGIDLPRTPPGAITPGWHVISVHLLKSHVPTYAEYRKLEPIDRVGYSFNIYYVAAEE